MSRVNRDNELIRTWRAGGFSLRLFDTGRYDNRGQSYLGYELRDARKLVFEGDDFAGSPLHADDSDATVASLLGFLSLRPGDTDADYFADYTPAQLAWCQSRGEELSMYATELEERDND